MKQKISLVLVFFLLLASTYGQKTKKITVSGYLKDKSNGENLSAATVYVKELKTGTAANVYGFYSLSLPTGTYTFVYSFLGYVTAEKTIVLDNNQTLNVTLEPKHKETQSVVIKSEKANANVIKPEMSVNKIEMTTIKEMPSFMGEADVVKAIQMLPGVVAAAEGTSGFSVRGGNKDQNLILLDEATVYNASHCFGFFSSFNNDALKDAKLYKGDIPVSYGGRLSSLLDLRLKNGNNQKFTGSGSVGLVSNKIVLEGPIVNENTSFLFGLRGQYLTNPFSNSNFGYYFYDVNAKINHTFDANNRIYVSTYFGRDKMFMGSNMDFNYGNQTLTVNWNHLFSDKLFSNTTLVYSKYDYKLGFESGSQKMTWDSYLYDFTAKMDYTYYLNANNTIKYGVSATKHIFQPGTFSAKMDNTIDYTVPNNHAFEYGAYLSNEQGLFDDLITLKYGVRLSIFQNIGPGTVYSYDSKYQVSDTTTYSANKTIHVYSNLEPRAAAVYNLSPSSSVKASYSRTAQYIQMASNSAAGNPLDIWFPADKNVKPQLADQFAVGYFRNFLDNTIETSVELYYKNMKNSIDFKENANLLLNSALDGELRFGKSYSYGAEFFVKLKTDKLTGWISYTYSQTRMKINEINEGKEYDSPYSRPHNISMILSYPIAKRLSISANWAFSSGMPMTVPVGRMEIDGKVVPIYSERNVYRLAPYHRLDLALIWKCKPEPNRKFNWELSLSAYNVYNRKNPWTVYYTADANDANTMYSKAICIPFFPAITYNFNF